MTQLQDELSDICGCEYPANIETVRKSCENREIELPDGAKTTLREILDIVENPPEQFESKQELYNFILSYAPSGSVGRVKYDDRNGNTAVEHETESL